MKCKICNSNAEHTSWTAKDMRVSRNEEFTYFQCIHCSCLQIKKIPKNISVYYPDNYYSFKKVSTAKHYDRLLKSYLRKTGAFLGTSLKWYGTLTRKVFSLPPHHEWFFNSGVSFGSRILDVGCGGGSLLLRIWKEGFTNASGIDPLIPNDINYKNGLKINKTTLKDLRKDSFFDLIMMHHSLEHIPNQFEAFHHINRLLKKGGIALIRIPVSKSTAWEHYRTNWIQLDAPRHLFLHSEKSINVLAAKYGLKIKKVIYDSLVFQFLGSELCKRGILMPDHKSYMKKEGKRIFQKSQLQNWEMITKELNNKNKGDMACFYFIK